MKKLIYNIKKIFLPITRLFSSIILLLILVIGFLGWMVWSIDGNVPELKSLEESHREKKPQTTPEVDPFCDSTKIRDFKNNLGLTTEKASKSLNDYQDKLAKDFIIRACKEDTLFCGNIQRKIERRYSHNGDWKFYLTGYVLDQAKGIEENSASFYVLIITKQNEIWFTDYFEDLIGEIKVELNGFESLDHRTIIWGHVSPYFKPDYGKFRLIIEDQRGYYEYECHAQH